MKDPRTGEIRKRKKPSISVTIDSLLLEEIDGLTDIVDMDRSQIISWCIANSLKEFREVYVKKKEVVDDRPKTKTIEDMTPTERWGYKILHDITGEGWQSS